MRQFILQVAPGGQWLAISWRGSALMLPMRQDGPTFRNGRIVGALLVDRGSGRLSSIWRDALIRYRRVLGCAGAFGGASVDRSRRSMIHGIPRGAPTCRDSGHRQPCSVLCLERVSSLSAAALTAFLRIKDALVSSIIWVQIPILHCSGKIEFWTRLKPSREAGHAPVVGRRRASQTGATARSLSLATRWSPLSRSAAHGGARLRHNVRIFRNCSRYGRSTATSTSLARAKAVA